MFLQKSTDFQGLLFCFPNSGIFLFSRTCGNHVHVLMPSPFRLHAFLNLPLCLVNSWNEILFGHRNQVHTLKIFEPASNQKFGQMIRWLIILCLYSYFKHRNFVGRVNILNVSQVDSEHIDKIKRKCSCSWNILLYKVLS